MATLKVLSDGRVIEHLFNPAPGQVVGVVEIEDPATPFNPLTFLTDGRSAESTRLRKDAENKAEQIARRYRGNA
jgi:hypothetical protein